MRKCFSVLSCTIFLSMGCCGTLLAQEVDPEVWAAWSLRNNLGPGSNWRDHLDIAPGSMGPNALPVPDRFAGRLSSHFMFAAEHGRHFMPGERSEDFGIRMLIPFGKNVNFRTRYIMREWYRYSDSLALARNTLTPAGSGSTSGDVVFDVLMQVLDQDRFPLSVLMGLHVKTASGEALEAMRYTDAPSYAFDLTLSRDIGALRLYGGGGFYVWQRFSLGAPQNDAFSYLGGLSWSGAAFQQNSLNAKGAVQLRSELSGYSGWTDGRDDIMLWRNVLEWQPAAAGWYTGLWIEKGFQDFSYTSIRLVAGRQFNWARG